MTHRDVAESELVAMEPLLHRLPAGADRVAISGILDDDFFEVGASGKEYRREFVIDVVEERYSNGVDPDDDAWEIDSLSIRVLADDVRLVTYRLSFAGRLSRRSTLWRRSEAGWRAIYHQGTICDS